MSADSSSPSQEDIQARKELAFHPVLFGIAPILAVYGQNLSVFTPLDLARPLLIMILMTLALVWLGSAALKSWSQAAGGVLPLLALWWLFSPLSKALGFLPAWSSGGALLLLCFLAAWGLMRWNPSPRFLNAFSVALGLLLIGSTVMKAASPPKIALRGAEAGKATPLPPGPRPDIFFIVPDGFGRLDLIKQKHGADLDWFRQELIQRGFQVADQSRSSYLQTQLSLSSTLNLNFLDTMTDQIGLDEGDRRVFGPLITDSLTAQILTASGYEHLTIGSGFQGIKLGGNELAIQADSTVTLFEATLLKKTPLSLLPWLDEVQAERHRAQVKGAFSAIKSLAPQGKRPRFVVAHLLSPHPPFVFDESGRAISPKGGFALADGDDYRRLVAGPEDYRRGYAKKAAYTAKMLLTTVDALLQYRHGSNPIIIIQGDHGSKLGVSHKSLDETDVAEGFSNFYALYAPPEIPIQLPELDSNVNTFRRVLTALGEKDLPPLEPKSWYSTYERPLEFTDVSDRVP